MAADAGSPSWLILLCCPLRDRPQTNPRPCHQPTWDLFQLLYWWHTALPQDLPNSLCCPAITAITIIIIIITTVHADKGLDEAQSFLQLNSSKLKSYFSAIHIRSSHLLWPPSAFLDRTFPSHLQLPTLLCDWTLTWSSTTTFNIHSSHPFSTPWASSNSIPPSPYLTEKHPSTPLPPPHWTTATHFSLGLQDSSKAPTHSEQRCYDPDESVKTSRLSSIPSKVPCLLQDAIQNRSPHPSVHLWQCPPLPQGAPHPADAAARWLDIQIAFTTQAHWSDIRLCFNPNNAIYFLHRRMINFAVFRWWLAGHIRSCIFSYQLDALQTVSNLWM